MRRSNRWMAAWALLVASSLLLRPASAAPDAGALRGARDELHAALHELASWCAARKLFRVRHDVYALVIELWPDDEVARKWNGYERGPDGWLLARVYRGDPGRVMSPPEGAQRAPVTASGGPARARRCARRLP